MSSTLRPLPPRPLPLRPMSQAHAPSLCPEPMPQARAPSPCPEARASAVLCCTRYTPYAPGTPPYAQAAAAGADLTRRGALVAFPCRRAPSPARRPTPHSCDISQPWWGEWRPARRCHHRSRRGRSRRRHLTWGCTTWGCTTWGGSDARRCKQRARWHGGGGRASGQGSRQGGRRGAS